MIFNKEFDKSLWLILNGDSKNKQLILDFIDMIPAPIYQQLLDAFVVYKKQIELDNIYVLDREDITGEFSVGNIRYYFILDMILNCLILGRQILVIGEYKKDFEMSLFSDSSYNKLEVFNNQYLGSIDGCLIENKINYELVNTFVGTMVLKKENNCLSKYKKININSFCNDMVGKSKVKKRF